MSCEVQKCTVCINVNPTIVTCNGEKAEDFYKHMNHEKQAIHNRCEFIYMGKSLTRILPYQYISKLVDNGEHVVSV